MNRFGSSPIWLVEWGYQRPTNPTKQDGYNDRGTKTKGPRCANGDAWPLSILLDYLHISGFLFVIESYTPRRLAQLGFSPILIGVVGGGIHPPTTLPAVMFTNHHDGLKTGDSSWSRRGLVQF